MSIVESRVWVEVDLKVIGQNVALLRQLAAPPARLLPLIKGDAYGCGAVQVGRAALAGGADWLGVELIEEAFPLREAGIQSPLLVLGPSGPQYAGGIAKHQLRVTVRDRETVEAVAAEAQRAQRQIPVHVELETGLNRLGIGEEPALDLIRRILSSPFLHFEGLWTHFAESEVDDAGFTGQQFRRYLAFVQRLEELGIRVPIRHVANSAALVRFPQMHLDMVRVGESVYGYLPERSLLEAVPLQPAVTWKTRLAQTRTVQPGESTSYGRTWTARRPSVLGSIPVGYADGYRRALSNKSNVLVRGRRAPVIGRVAMHTIVIDLTDIPGASAGDEVVLMGRQGEEEVSAYELGAWAGSTEFETLIGIFPHVERVYV